MSRTVLGLLVVGQLTCHQAILTAPPGATLFLTVNPPFIPAHGGVAVVSALLLEEPGTLVPDGTVVQFFTTLGRIDEQGRTNDGVARVNLTSDSRSGPARVTATSGVATAEANVDIGAILPQFVIVTADPPRIILTVSRTTHVFANVFDSQGNPVPNVPVIFQVIPVVLPSPAPSPPPNGTDFVENGADPLHTDNNGRVERILRTIRPLGSLPAVARVEAVVLSGTARSGTVDVPIQ